MDEFGNIYLTDDFYADEALNEKFQLVVSDIKNNIDRNTVISIALINRLLPVGYNRAKQFFLKLKEKGYLDDKGRLLFDDASEDKKSSSGNGLVLKTVQELCVENACSMSSKDAPPNQNSLLISSGFPKIDKLLGGFEKGKMYMIAGRPGYGKSVLALNIALNIASNPFINKSVLYISTESTEKDMNEQVFSDRLIANLANVSIDEIKADKNLSLHERMALLKKLKQFNSETPNGKTLSKLHFSFMDGVDVSLIKESISLLNSCEQGISCIIVDPIIKYPTPPSLYKKHLEFLKDLAQKLNVPVILTSRTTRVAMRRIISEWRHPEKMNPIVEDLAFSEVVKEYADFVFFIGSKRLYKMSKDLDFILKLALTVYKEQKRLDGPIRLVFWQDFIKIESNTGTGRR